MPGLDGCPTCGGSGKQVHILTNPTTRQERREFEPCPTCAWAERIRDEAANKAVADWLRDVREAWPALWDTPDTRETR